MGILIVCHGNLSEQFVEAARLICQDKLQDIQSVSVSTDLERDEVMDMTLKSLDKFGPDVKKVVVFCDMYGATASRLICEHEFDSKEMVCVFGLNLSMLLDCINYRTDEMELDKLVDRICDTGKKAIYAKAPGDNGAQ